MQRLLDFDSSFIRGSNSSMDPSQLPTGYVWNCVNMINVSGVLSCRPGHKCVIKMPRGKLQGAAIFRPNVGLEQMLIAIDGNVYVSDYPFNTPRKIEGVQFLPEAKQVFFTQTIQTAQRIEPGSLTSAIELISPKAVIIMQDGGFTAPAYYDGSQSGHIKGLPFQTPAGGTMKWIGDRLWVSVGADLFASDISNPFSFVEQIYLGGTVGFHFSRDITALSATPNVEFPQLLVFTDETTSLIQADIRDRGKWPTTDGFQKEILQFGCTGPRAVISHAGRLVWFSSTGVIVYDSATAGKLTGRSPIRDNEMMVSKKFLKDDLSQISIGAFGQWVLISVPSEDTYNKHTWVYNSASWETVGDEGGPTWSGHWLGTRPVEWIHGVIVGSERIYHVSVDTDGENRLWESFRPEKLDNGCPIAWMLETRGYFGLTSPSKKPPGFTCRYGWADVALTAVAEDLDLGVFVAPGVRGQYQQILGKRISVRKGSLSFDRQLNATSKIFAYKSQGRTERTQDFSQMSPNDASGSCPTESTDNDDKDESFQVLVAGHGPVSIRWIRSFATEVQDEDFSGDPKACENEEAFNIVRFDGAGVFNEDLDVAEAEIAARTIQNHSSTKTATVSQEGISATGVGSSESIVAQQAADRVAEIIATKQADLEVVLALPKFLSLGLE